MAILCARYSLVFTHVPKTGGEFVERLLTDYAGGRKVGGRHDSFRRLELKRIPKVRVFTVRDPVDWYVSYWAFQRQVATRGVVWPTWDPGPGVGGHPTAELDRRCGAPTFERFVLRALSEFPNGFVRSMYCRFLNGATHVMRTSHLHEDLEALLRLVSFDRPSVVRDSAPTNRTRRRYKKEADLSADTEQRIREIDNLEGLRFPFVAGSSLVDAGGQ
jgi:hypothetical protein